MTDHDAEPPPKKHPRETRRRRTLYDYIIAVGSIAGALAAVGVVLGFVMEKLPFAMAADMSKLDTRVSSLEKDVGDIKGNTNWNVQLSLEQAVISIRRELKDVSLTPSSRVIMRQLCQDKRADLARVNQLLNLPPPTLVCED